MKKDLKWDDESKANLILIISLGICIGLYLKSIPAGFAVIWYCLLARPWR